MAQQHCVVNEVYALTLEHRSTWRWLLHPWGVIPSLHILLSSCFVYQCFCRSTASGAVLWSFPGPRSTSDLCWGSRGAVGEARMSVILSPPVHSAGVQLELVVVFPLDFTECVITPSLQKQALYDSSTLTARPRSTQYENIWNIRRHKKGKTQGEMSKLFSLLTIYLHSFSRK